MLNPVVKVELMSLLGLGLRLGLVDILDGLDAETLTHEAPAWPSQMTCLHFFELLRSLLRQ
jgi:hypothetical protein